ncbi:hypothetical protein FFLO_01660 [Filobasidium floriforme]|uniref:Uncharacterized protein n=1 Tax=Filobasidium floriforme TaxID=5210 RepID=A0A8K0NSN2_9TREE|nr:uncharacterized protein HD553DRAFT_344864 [Filobasidium floriforme]KAG7562970.1 hypothetical protein FFLO_01660 [Filobasidium floriforme]KAH8080577.1 hypothetical protein HD553DRAFT_344864 [Filobasidium floriforme]
MSPTDSQPKESSIKPAATARPVPTRQSSPSIITRFVNGLQDVQVLGWVFLETLLSPVLDPSSWTRPPTDTPAASWPAFRMGGNRVGGGNGGGARSGGGGGGFNTGSNNPRGGAGNGTGRRLGGMGTMGGLAGSGGSE